MHLIVWQLLLTELPKTFRGCATNINYYEMCVFNILDDAGYEYVTNENTCNDKWY